MPDNDEFLQQFWLNTVCAAFGAGAHAFASDLDKPDLAAVVTHYDVVFAVWSDRAVSSGFQMIAIHGLQKMLVGTPGSPDGNLRMNAIPVVDRAAAEKLLARFGDPSWPPQYIQPRGAVN
jgi:hypothetical protein